MFPESFVFALQVSGCAKEWRMALNIGQFVFQKGDAVFFSFFSNKKLGI